MKNRMNSGRPATFRLATRWQVALAAVLCFAAAGVEHAVAAEAAPVSSVPYRATVVRIAMRDGVELAGNLISPGHGRAAPVVVSITPYGRHALHVVGAVMARAGMAFLAVDVRGRGDSGGTFQMFRGDLNDTVDVLRWAQRQPFSNGRHAMWGASYGGFNQWMGAARKAPGLAAINPAASVYPGWDFPMIGGISYPYAATWTSFTLGRMANFPLFNDAVFWRAMFTDVLQRGLAFKEIDQALGLPSPLFQEWAAHPDADEYWRTLNPTAAEMAAIDLPILSVTGLYDGAQAGALRYYREHMALASESARAKHYLVLGPYDHAGVTFPRESVAGLPVPDKGGMDPIRLAIEWYAHALIGAPRPEFLRDRVMYYVMGANEWRSAPSLEAIPVRARTFYPAANGLAATSVGSAGVLSEKVPPSDNVTYRYDPADRSKATLGNWFEGPFALDSADVAALNGDGFVFETEPLAAPMEIIGQPSFTADLSVDAPDADFRLRLYEIRSDGVSVYMSEARLRARYRYSMSAPQFISSSRSETYRFDQFSFAARRLEKGSRIRFVLDAPNSIYVQRNYNAAKPVAEQTPADARTTTVAMRLGGRRPATLTLPMRNVD